MDTALINYIIDLAKSEEYRIIKLHVVDRSTRARGLYERIGFKIIESRKVPFFLKKFYNFSKIYIMSYSISE